MKRIKKIKSMLYVEDEKKIQKEMSELLINFCEELFVCDDGVQGVNTYKEHQPEVVISDIRMPYLDGIEMAKKLKEINKNVYIVFTTAFSDRAYFQEAIELQLNGYIIKPINMEIFEKKISSILEDMNRKIDNEIKSKMLIQKSKLASMAEMISNITHQWKQPLSAISSSVSGLQLKLEYEKNLEIEYLESCADTVLKQTNYLANTIDDFKYYIKSGNNTILYNLKEYMEKCVNLVKSSFDQNTIETIKEIDEKVDFCGDPNQLTQAIINILNNSRDALKQAKGIQKKLVFILSVKEKDKDNLLISIKDNAGGIPDNIIDRIFEPYFSTKSSDQGVGLGLYITYTIITENLNGTINVYNDEFTFENEKYKGARFDITLPLKP